MVPSTMSYRQRRLRNVVRRRRWTIAKVRSSTIRSPKCRHSKMSLLNLPDDVLGIIFKYVSNGFKPLCVRDVLALAGVCRHLRYIAQQFLDVVNVSNLSVQDEVIEDAGAPCDADSDRAKSLLRLTANVLREVSLGRLLSGSLAAVLRKGGSKLREVSLIDDGKLTLAETLKLFETSNLHLININRPKMMFFIALKETLRNPKHIMLHELLPHQFEHIRGIVTEGIERLEINSPAISCDTSRSFMTYIDLISDTPFAPGVSRVSDAFQMSVDWYLQRCYPFAITRQSNDLEFHACDKARTDAKRSLFQAVSLCSALIFPTLNVTGYYGARPDLRILLFETSESVEILRWRPPPLSIGWYALVNSFAHSIRVDLPSYTTKLIRVPISTFVHDISLTNTHPHIIHAISPANRIKVNMVETFLRACTVPEANYSLRAIHVDQIPKISASFAQVLTRLFKLTTSIRLLDVHTVFVEELWASAHGAGHCMLKAGGVSIRSIHIRSSDPFPERLNFLITLPRFLASVDRCCSGLTSLDLHCRSSPVIKIVSRRRWQKPLDEAISAFEQFAGTHSNLDLASFRESLGVWRIPTASNCNYHA